MFSIDVFKKKCSKEWQIIFNANISHIQINEKETLFHEGEPVKGIFFIEKGKMKILSRFGSSDQKIIRLATDKMVVGHRGINTKIYPITAISLTDTILTFLPIDIFITLLRANPDLSMELIDFMADELRDAEERLNNNYILDPRQRVAKILLRIVNCFGYDKFNPKKLSYTVSRADIANMAGTTYETIIRTLSLFEREKIVELVGKEICIINEIQLNAIALGKNENKSK